MAKRYNDMKIDINNLTAIGVATYSTIKTDDKRTIIIEYIHRNGEAKTEDLVKLLSSSTTRIKMLLYQMVDEGILVSCGGNRNRIYKLKEQEQL